MAKPVKPIDFRIRSKLAKLKKKFFEILWNDIWYDDSLDYTCKLKAIKKAKSFWLPCYAYRLISTNSSRDTSANSPRVFKWIKETCCAKNYGLINVWPAIEIHRKQFSHYLYQLSHEQIMCVKNIFKFN